MLVPIILLSSVVNTLSIQTTSVVSILGTQYYDAQTSVPVCCTYHFLFLFPDHYLGLNGLNMRDTGDATYTPSSSQPLNPNIPYSPDGMTDTYYNLIIVFSKLRTIQSI